ncbi:Histone deacetylase 8 [Spiromyces aspiralis]|uniref:Histone deacetylase 8 n=1 Tax=Spiromyces aspiralis TaxID=68401 RepID=A0ACC1HUJ2_9FUNG|nr:Histone deacetylase 8 [Spiromyces aspiralis]
MSDSSATSRPARRPASLQGRVHSEYGDGDNLQPWLEEFGLEQDCPLFDGIYEYVLTTAGGTLAAAECLLSGAADIAIHWEGGRHHAARDHASGFCYVNDVVLGIHRLQRGFDRILYIDLDLHHGDGVQNAFLYSRSVFTLSFHYHSPGFYPGTGSLREQGKGKAQNHALNVPLGRYLTDGSLRRVFDEISARVVSYFKPDVVVVQCGCDGLATDPHRAWNLTPVGYVSVIEAVRGWGLPTMLLGGGGYDSPSVARCWAQVTAAVTQPGVDLDREIPEHCYFEMYKPTFEISIEPATAAVDENSDEYIASVVAEVAERLRENR